MDRLTGSVMGFPFQDAEPEPVSGAAGATVHTEFNKVESSEDLATALSVDARAEARFGLFDGGASLSLDKSMKMNRYSLYLYALAKVELAFQQVESPAYKPEVLELLRQPGGSAAFRKAYGDSFIRGMATGGQLLSLIEIHTKTVEEKRELDTHLSGSYGFAVEGSLDLEQKFASSASSVFSRTVRHQVGGTPVNIQKPDDVVPAVQAWVQEMGSGSSSVVPYQVGLVSYDTVPVPGAEWLDASMAEANLDVLAASRKTFQDNLNDVIYVLSNQDEFTWTDTTGTFADMDAWVVSLDEWSRKLKENIAVTEKRARDIAKDLTVPLEGWDPIPLTGLQLPPRKVSSEPAATPPPEGAVGTLVTFLPPGSLELVGSFTGVVRDHRGGGG